MTVTFRSPSPDPHKGSREVVLPQGLLLGEVRHEGQLRDTLIRYPAAFGKGPAWSHLLEFPVYAELNGALYTPDNSPDSNGRPYNPYRKRHTHEFWAWSVTRWKPAPAIKAKAKVTPGSGRTRYKMLQDDWLPDTAELEAITGGDAAPSKEVPMTAGVKVLEGLKILLKYRPRSDVAAEHEAIYAGGPQPDQLTEDDRIELTNLGWAYDVKLTSWRKFT